MARNRPIEFTVPLAGAIGVDACRYYREMSSVPQQASSEEAALQAMILKHKNTEQRLPPSSATVARPCADASKEDSKSLPPGLDLSSLKKPWRVGMKAKQNIEPGPEEKRNRAPTEEVGCKLTCLARDGDLR